MDRLNQLRGEAGTSRDSTLDTSSPPSEAFMTANESSSKYFSLSEVDSTFDISPIKDESISSTTVDTEREAADSDQLISNLSPIGKKNDFLDGYKIGKQIEAANILSGGVDIFDDNENSYDGDELVIDDNPGREDKSEGKVADLSQLKPEDVSISTPLDPEPVPSKNTEVILQIDGRNVDAIDIGNGLYLYRKAGEEELAAVQIIDDDQQQPSFKFLKVRENVEGNLEVYEEIQIEVPKEVPIKKGKVCDKSVSHVPIKNINKVISDSTSNKASEKKNKLPIEVPPTNVNEIQQDANKEPVPESKTEVNVNGKMIKFSESRKSPVVGSFTPMTYHSTPNKEGIPLTKIMVDKQLHPSRHSDNIKKTIEVHTDNAKQKTSETQNKLPNELVEEIKENDKPLQKTDLKLEIKEINTGDKKSETKIEEGKLECTKNKAVDLSDNNTNKTDPKSIPALSKTLEKEIPAVPKEVESRPNINDKLVEPPQETGDMNVVKIDKEELSSSNETVVETPKSTEKKTENKEHTTNIEVPKSTEACVLHISKEKSEELSVCMEITSSENRIETTTTNLQSKLDTINSSEKPLDNSEHKKEDIINFSAPAVTKTGENPNTKVDNASKIELPKITVESKTETAITTVDNNKDNLDAVCVLEDKVAVVDKVASSENTAEPGAQQVPNTDKVFKTDERVNINKETQNIKETLECESAKCIKSPIPDSTLEQKTKSSDRDVQIEKRTECVATKQNIPNTLETKEEIIIYTSNAKEESKKDSNKSDSHICISDNKDKKEIPNPDSKPVTQDTGQIENISVKKTLPIMTDSKPAVNNNVAVPFGKWTEANRQAFLIKIKEAKVPTNSSNGKQIKNSNDLNRRDVLKKIDSQRQSQAVVTSSKVQDFGSANRLAVKKEASVFSAKPSATQESKVVKAEAQITKINSATTIKVKQEPVTVNKPLIESNTSTTNTKKEEIQRKEINNQDLIDKTVEDIITRGTKSNTELDELEMKMNELHGIPFVERPEHELPKTHNPGLKTLPKSEPQKPTSKQSKIPNLLPFNNKTQQKGIKENADVDSEEEVIEHEPITGDMDQSKKSVVNPSTAVKQITVEKNANNDKSSKDSIITETDFEKFVRRNSVSYENCITVNFEGKEPHNVIKTVVQKDAALKTYSRKETSHIDSKAPISQKHESQNLNSAQANPNPKPDKLRNPVMLSDNDSNKNYQSKVKMAYQTAMTAKRQMERPISIIEDKPVKVVYMDATEFVPSKLNAHGKELSPSKKLLSNIDLIATSNSDSLDSDILDSADDGKLSDEAKVKPKHQRKQVLTPVENPELELIEPDELGVEISPKKKRKTDEKSEKITKTVVPKKTYLLGRSPIAEETLSNPYDPPIHPSSKHPHKDVISQETIVKVSPHKNAASAIDELVKAAELLETQSANLRMSTTDAQKIDNSPSSPVKRGRGRPRKYPLPEGSTEKVKIPIPQKKPRLIDAKKTKVIDSEDDDTGTDDEIIKENWTMGKINENIVCPICNKLFRSENVVFKHVKHCTGPSPNRSDSDNRSPRRFRESREFDLKYDDKDDLDDDVPIVRKEVRKKHKSRDVHTKSMLEKDDIIVIEDTPVKPKPERKKEEMNLLELKRSLEAKNKHSDKSNNLVCEFCGKTFRQLSYLVSHKMQHEKEDVKKNDSELNKSSKSIFSCEVCKKEFRKLHHLVQHRIIHNPTGSTKSSRKNSVEQQDKKVVKEENIPKQSDDPSAGFRCEPCDKSFRKLHHLVEHRETHDGINKQKNTTTPVQVEKLPPPPQCDICKKTFRKIHHLIEHREQHLETSSEKSDDKSVKSSLSTKDIIHECPLCYMVFPNEHSLNKHHIICQRKKRQSATKQIKQAEDGDKLDEDKDTVKSEEDRDEKDDDITIVSDDLTVSDKPSILSESEDTQPSEVESDVKQFVDKPIVIESLKCEKPKDKDTVTKVEAELKGTKDVENKKTDLPVRLKSTDEKEIVKAPQEIPKKKSAPKEKVAATVTKRNKSNLPLPAHETVKPESSDDEDVRYMFNPDYNAESELFMKVRATKRNSLQIERPNSKDLVKRRISLQHPPKIPRLKAKPIPAKAPAPAASTTLAKNIPKLPKLEPAPSTDSDDSDVKYSFPKTASTVTKVTKSGADDTPLKELKKTQRKSLAEKRKSLSGIAKRKSIGRAASGKCKAKPSPVKLVKKRIAEAEYRCDCGQLFSSAALLARHTTLAHTPPRIRRRRSPPPPATAAPPPPAPAPAAPRPLRRSVPAAKPRPCADARKSSVKSEASGSSRSAHPPAPAPAPAPASASASRKSIVNRTDAGEPSEGPKPWKGGAGPAPARKARRGGAHRGVPVPEKMRKLMEKTKK